MDVEEAPDSDVDNKLESYAGWNNPQNGVSEAKLWIQRENH